MKRARLRSNICGHVVEEDAIVSTAEEWPGLVKEDRSLASWRTATHADGTLVAMEPVLDVVRRVLGAGELVRRLLGVDEARGVVHQPCRPRARGGLTMTAELTSIILRRGPEVAYFEIITSTEPLDAEDFPSPGWRIVRTAAAWLAVRVVA
jgi:hypothetical protein